MEENKARIRTFLSSQFPTHELGDEDDFFSRGFVNSLFAMQLVMFVEREFDVRVEDEDLDIENFNTVNAIAALVARKTVALR